jgi:hypothetical protein
MSIVIDRFLLMKKTVLALYICMLAVPALAEQTKPSVKLVKGDNRVDVKIGGKLFTSYIYGSKLTKPVLVPIRTLKSGSESLWNSLLKIRFSKYIFIRLLR